MVIGRSVGRADSPGIVNDELCSAGAQSQRLEVIEITFDPLNVEAIESRSIRIGSDKCPNKIAALEERAGEMRTNESIGTGYKGNLARGFPSYGYQKTRRVNRLDSAKTEPFVSVDFFRNGLTVKGIVRLRVSRDTVGITIGSRRIPG